MSFRKTRWQPRGGLRPSPVPNLVPAFAQRRAVFGPVDLRDDRIRAEGYLADDLSAEARRVIRDRFDGRA